LDGPDAHESWRRLVTEGKGVDAGLLQTRYRLTKQRAAILRALEDGAHLTAEAIHERVRAELPAVSLGTIYRTLDILRAIGLVQVFAHGGAARYEAALDKHHHLVCVACGEIVNVPVPQVVPIALAVAQDHRYSGVDATMVISGRCARCAGLARNGIGLG
jgi:Fur family ferric uptake transcriptional regulator